MERMPLKIGDRFASEKYPAPWLEVVAVIPDGSAMVRFLEDPTLPAEAIFPEQWPALADALGLIPAPPAQP